MGAHEQRPTEFLLEGLDPRAHRRLGHVEVVGRPVEVSAGGDFEEGFDVIEVHGQTIYTIEIFDSFDQKC